MKITYLLIIILLLSVSIAYAGQGKAIVKMNITNMPPEIINITIIPETPYPDSEIICNATFIDEDIDKVSLQTEWYKNNKLIENINNAEFKAGDEIKCKITPNDLAQNGTSMETSVIIQEPKVSSIILKNTLNFLGSETSLEEISTQQKQGLASVTGFVVAEGAKNKSTFSLIGILFILAIVNINLILRRKRKVYKD